MAIVYSVLMNKGGVGKSSLVTNLAAALNLTYQNKKILILDTDGQGNASIAFNQNPNTMKRTLYDCIIDGVSPEETILTLQENLDLLPANDDMNYLEFDVLTDLQKYPNPFSLLQPIIKKLTDRYDYIFVDSPPSMGLIAGNILSITDYVILPFMPETFSVQGLIKVLKTIDEFQKEQGVKASIGGVVGMMIDGRSSLHSDLVLQARVYCDAHGIRTFNTRIPRTVRFANATAAYGMPAVLADKHNEMVKVYFDLMEEVIHID
jgi:chromosome partitioning protein